MKDLDLDLDFGLAGKVALITGSGKGIGKTIAMLYAQKGADIILVGRSSNILETEKDVIGTGRSVLSLIYDITEPANIKKIVTESISRFGKIDILVNNAGVVFLENAEDLSKEKWDQTISVNLTAPFLLSQAAGKEMIKQGSGKIINIASVNGIGAFPERACYGSAKAGVMQLTRTLACEWARHNINVNAVAPGYIRTQLVDELLTKGTLNEAEIAGRTPAGRLGECSEIADAVIFLATDEAKYIVGQTLVVDGGWSAYMYLESWLEKSK